MDIFEAVNSGDCAQILKYISQVGCASDGETPLMIAIQKRVMEPINILINHGADTNAPNEDGWTPLHYAIHEGRLEIVKLLVESGAYIHTGDKRGDTALHLAAYKNQIAIARFLIGSGADVNLSIKDGTLPLIGAACDGHNDMVELLLHHGADPNLGTAIEDNTALTWAAQKCSYAAVKALLDAGANPWHETKDGVTPLAMTSDAVMQRLISEYQRADGPSWLVRELSSRGMPWETLCGVQDKLCEAGFTEKQDFLSMPHSHFDTTHLRAIGITSVRALAVLEDVRLQATWVGARLSALGVSYYWLGICECVVFHNYGCLTAESFAHVLPDELSDECLEDMGIVSGFVRRCLRAVHAQVCEEQTNKKNFKQLRSVSAAAGATIVPGFASAGSAFQRTRKPRAVPAPRPSETSTANATTTITDTTLSFEELEQKLQAEHDSEEQAQGETKNLYSDAGSPGWERL